MSHAVRAGRQCRGREHDDLRRTAAQTSTAGTLVDLVTAPVDPARVAAALADAARLGGYATVVPDVAGAPVSRVYADGPELDRRSAQVRAALHCDERVAASLAQQGTKTNSLCMAHPSPPTTQWEFQAHQPAWRAATFSAADCVARPSQAAY